MKTRLAKFSKEENMQREEPVLMTELNTMARYQLGRSTLRNMAKELNAAVHITPRCLRYRIDILDKAFLAGAEK